VLLGSIGFNKVLVFTIQRNWKVTVFLTLKYQWMACKVIVGQTR